ncbi:MAG: DHA2 family efflux MFS transporter permease subunit [Gammaproteobacteria bacterium]
MQTTYSRSQRWLVTVAVMSATLMQILDTTIVNVALPHMQGAMGVTPDQITWVLTSYLVASAIVMPLTGYFTDRLGRKNYLLLCIFGFVVASALCGMAHSITEIVLFRLLQGLLGASLVPLSQAILVDVFPREQRGQAMAIWGMGVMVGPILGPTLGGYLTEVASWRWNFYINLPVGIISLLLAWYIVPNTPKVERKMDWIGLSLISIGIASIQFFLDRGNNEDWFDAVNIRIAALLAVGGIGGFIIYSLNGRIDSVFDLRIFKDRNFTTGCIIMAVFGLGLFGTMVILPQMLEDLMQYPVLMTGLVMAPRGISGMVSMMFVGKLINRYDPRLLIVIGIFLSALGTWAATSYNLTINTFWIIWPLLLQGLGMGLVFVPITTVAFATLPDKMRAEAAGIFSLVRTIGSSIGISIIATIYSRHFQMAWNQIGGFIQPYNPQLYSYLHSAHLKPNDPNAIGLLARELGRQAQMVSFLDVFAFISWSFIVVLPLVFLIKNQKSNHPVEAIEA